MRAVHLAVVLLEVIGIAVVASGIVVEVVERAPIGFVLISAGSLAVGAGGFLWAKLGLTKGLLTKEK